MIVISNSSLSQLAVDTCGEYFNGMNLIESGNYNFTTTNAWGVIHYLFRVKH